MTCTSNPRVEPSARPPTDLAERSRAAAVALARVADGAARMAAEIAALRAELDDVVVAVAAQADAAEALRAENARIAAAYASLLRHLEARHAADAIVLAKVAGAAPRSSSAEDTSSEDAAAAKEHGRDPRGQKRTTPRTRDRADRPVEPSPRSCAEACSAGPSAVDEQAAESSVAPIEGPAGRPQSAETAPVRDAVLGAGPVRRARGVSASPAKKVRISPSPDLVADAADVAAATGETIFDVLDRWMRAGRAADARAAPRHPNPTVPKLRRRDVVPTAGPGGTPASGAWSP